MSTNFDVPCGTPMARSEFLGPLAFCGAIFSASVEPYSYGGVRDDARRDILRDQNWDGYSLSVPCVGLSDLRVGS